MCGGGGEDYPTSAGQADSLEPQGRQVGEAREVHHQAVDPRPLLGCELVVEGVSCTCPIFFTIDKHAAIVTLVGA